MDFRITRLDNGLHVVTAPMPGMYSVTASVIISVGSRHESDSEAGSAHLIEHMLFKGTEKRPTAEAISETIERVGGLLNASTDKDLTVYWAKVSKDKAELAIDLLSDMVLHSKFDRSEVEKERRVVIEELGMSIDSPQDWVHTLIDEQCWPGTPIGRDVGGTRESVAALTRGGLVRFMRQHYRPDTTIVSLAGGISHDNGVELAARMFGDWNAGKAPAPSEIIPIEYPRLPPSLFYDERGTEQVNICLASRGIARTSPDRYAFELLTSILGGSMSSRLFLEIRERRGLAYDIHSYGNTVADTGSLVTYAAVDPKHCTDVLREVLRQMNLLRSGNVTAAELEKVKDNYKGRLLLGLEDTQSVAGWCGVQQALYGEIRQPEDVCDDVDRVSLEDVQRIAAECFETEYLRLVALGPSAGAKGLQSDLHL
jgi:predicted Zn-dependent peptidase